MTSSPLQGTTLIVGAGIFGTSAAYHLSQAGEGSVIVVDQHDFPTPGADSVRAPQGASHDINKVVRADYTVKFHMNMALEAIEKWRSWDLIAPFYHQTGWIVMSEKGDGMTEKLEKVRQNFRECKGYEVLQPMQIDAIEQVAGGAFQGLDRATFERAYLNPDVAWVEADKAVEAVLGEAVKNGVTYVKGKVEELIHDPAASRIKGVALQDGTIIEADRTLLATGAWTSALMNHTEESLNLPDNQRIESQVKAAAVCNVHFSLSEEESDPYMHIPIFVYGSLGKLNASRKFKLIAREGEVLPPPRSRLLKFNNSTSFTNTVEVNSGRSITCPTATSQFDVPEALKKETLSVVRKAMPRFVVSQSKIDFFRICWDAVTPEQHQLITQHPSPHLKNLFFAIGGSFHGWKFLPTIGSKVANVVRGISNGKEMDHIWGWKWGGWAMASDGGAHSDLIPQREFRSFLGAESGLS